MYLYFDRYQMIDRKDQLFTADYDCSFHVCCVFNGYLMLTDRKHQVYMVDHDDAVFAYCVYFNWYLMLIDRKS